MEYTSDKSNKTNHQAASTSLIKNTTQNKTISLQDNRPATIFQRKENKVNINDDRALENEADQMGAKALQTKSLTNSLSQTKLQKQSPIVQRTVLSKIQSLKKGGTRTVYYSTYDPSQEFENQFDAWRLDTRLANEHNDFSEEARYPTVFTHYNTDSHNVPPAVGKAGPHTVSHSSLSFRLAKKIKKHSLEKIRDEQVVTLDEFIKLLNTEAPSKFKKSQRKRLIKDYKISYERLQKIIDGGKENYPGEGHELLMRLIQLNPYTVYGKGKSVSKGRIKHKGERKEDDFETSIDNKAKFNSEENYSNFKSKRKKLYEDSSEEEKEEKDNEHKHKDKKTKSVSLSPLDVMVLLGRTIRGALYIMNDDDWDAYELYKRNHPENKYPR
ncbi:hypothetical protein [Flavobacterium sp. KACC 22763]|uniref:hypothetical protein n=1 Tax=Flavobacterium sp. KACC 22763 TaxID=3025668 RepID=UPI002365C7DE|nr:hypothetical protein [Flavobacterium sp. KACC 22763]WDF65963.1 hypothetical protein PQ463_07270 [Flavobacterium sp. KACC 22763]